MAPAAIATALGQSGDPEESALIVKAVTVLPVSGVADEEDAPTHDRKAGLSYPGRRIPMTPSPETTFVWLIERYDGSALVYWSGRRKAGQEFTPDANWAVRFARVEDAEQVRGHIAVNGDCCRSVQHGFSPLSALAGSSPAPTCASVHPQALERCSLAPGHSDCHWRRGADGISYGWIDPPAPQLSYPGRAPVMTEGLHGPIGSDASPAPEDPRIQTAMNLIGLSREAAIEYLTALDAQKGYKLIPASPAPEPETAQLIEDGNGIHYQGWETPPLPVIPEARARILQRARGAYIENNVLKSYEISTDAAYLAAAREALLIACELLEHAGHEGWMGEDVDGDVLAARRIRAELLTALSPDRPETTK